MENLLKLLLLSALPFVACQGSLDYHGIPDQCHSSPDLLYSQCCLFPPFFTRDVAKGCGAMFQVLPFDAASHSAGLRRITPYSCRYWKCLLKTYDLLSSDGNVDIVRYYVHLDKWVELNSQFSNVMGDAKVHCKQFSALKLPLNPCELNHLHRCIRNYIAMHCPLIVNTDLCKKQKDFFEECGKYYV